MLEISDRNYFAFVAFGGILVILLEVGLI